MKKLFIFLASLFLMGNVLADAPPLPMGFEDTAIAISDSVKLTPIVKHEINPGLHYKIGIHIPQLTGAASPAIDTFNRYVNDAVNQEVKQFKDEIEKNAAQSKTLPEPLQRNALRVDYDVDILKPNNQILLALRLNFIGMLAGMAHPFHHRQSFNFDYTHNRQLTLNDLFKSNSNYLQILSKYSSDKLNEKLKNQNQFVAEGTAPVAKNFKNWNLQADGILITFDEAQVAPAVFGRVEVSIPYSALKDVIAPNSPITECVKNPKNCEVG